MNILKHAWFCIVLGLLSSPSYGQYISSSLDLNQQGALALAKQANLESQKLDKNVSVAILNASRVVLLLLKGDNVGPHNTEASRRKAYTALSTKTASLELMRNTSENKETRNLNTLPELLLLGGGVPLWKDGQLVGSIGVSGGGGGQKDHDIAVKEAQVLGFQTKQ